MIRIIFSVFVCIAALLSGNAWAAGATLADDAPDSYTVVKGDTLWGISGRFLKQPWRWPEVWRMNKAQIRNPHLIDPGQVVLLDRSGPWLSVGRRVGGSSGTTNEKLYPQIYVEGVSAAIPSIPLKDIEPFLNHPLIIDQTRLEGSATIIATDTSRVYMGAGDTVFAKNVPEDIDSWQVYRPARALTRPGTDEIIAYEAVHLGSARVTKHGNPATLELISANEEIGTGDLMLPSERPTVFSYVPHEPDTPIAGQLISIHRGVVETGKMNIIALDVGARDGLEAGHVLALYRNRGTAEFNDDGVKEKFVLPEKRYGLAFVFRVFDRVSYALVMESDGPVTIGDSLRNP